MACMEIEHPEPMLREAVRVLAADGRFVASLCHPCFDLNERSGWVVEQAREPDGRWRSQVWRKVRAYRDERAVRVPWAISDTETGFTLAHHRTLSTLVRMLRDAGPAITRLEEPTPLPEAIRESPRGAYLAEIPLLLVIEARIVPGLPRRGKPLRVTPPRSPTTGGTPRGGDRRSGVGGRRPGNGSRSRGSRNGS